MINRSAKIGEATVVVKVDVGLENLADWLLNVLIKMHQSGRVLEDGKSIQLGWSTLFLRRQQDGDLIVCEPNFARDPFSEEVPGATCTLKIQASQMEFASRVKIVPEVTKFQEKIVLEKGCLSVERIYMTRAHPDRDAGDSGWFIGSQKSNDVILSGNASSEFEAIYAYELLQLRPELFPALILPSGFMVMAGSGGIIGVVNSENEMIAL
ncbi:hypothetical protein WKI45_16245 [Delftia tsuruhatensis]